MFGSPNLFIYVLVVFLNCVFLQDRFNVLDIDIYLKPHFLQVQKNVKKKTLLSTTDFSLTSAKKPQSFLVLLCESKKSIVTIQLAAQNADKFKLKMHK